MKDTMRPFKSGKNVVENGFIARNINKVNYINHNLIALTNGYHQPYKCDWGKATSKAKEKIRLLEIRKNYSESNDNKNPL